MEYGRGYKEQGTMVDQYGYNKYGAPPTMNDVLLRNNATMKGHYNGPLNGYASDANEPLRTSFDYRVPSGAENATFHYGYDGGSLPRQDEQAMRDNHRVMNGLFSDLDRVLKK